MLATYEGLVKKCASCTKDLPDAALHCVFCGAKQPPAPATQGGMAKTAFGSYSASDMIEQLKNQPGGLPRPGQPPPPYNPPVAAPYNPPPPPYNPPAPPAYNPPAPPAYNPPAAVAATYTPPAPPSAQSPALMKTVALTPGGGGYQPPTPPSPAGHGGVPSASSAAPTMFVQGGPPPQGNFNPGARPGYPAAPPTYQAPPSPVMPAPVPQRPIAQIPSAAPPYLASQTAARAGRPIEPWKDSLRLWMFIWGGALLVAFATPQSVEPLVFNWDAIINGEGTQKLPPLIMAAVGLLSIVLAFIPTSPAPRGLIAGALGLAGIIVPMVLGGMPPWQLLVPVAGMLLLIPGLVMRQEYRDALLPRILVTLGAIASLVVYLLPVDGHLPLVDLFKAVLDMPGASKIIFLLVLGQITIVVLSLLAWLPAPASGGANVFAWLLILWPMISTITLLVVSGVIGDVITKTPYGIVAWVAGGGGGGGAMMISVVGLGAAYAVLVGYGLATVIGKKLE